MLLVIHSGLHVSGQKLGGKMLDQSLMGSASVLAKIQRLLVYKLPNCYAVRECVDLFGSLYRVMTTRNCWTSKC